MNLSGEKYHERFAKLPWLDICYGHFLSTHSYQFCYVVPLNSPAMNCKVGAQDFTSFIACHCRQLRAANAHNNAKIGSYYDKRKPQGLP